MLSQRNAEILARLELGIDSYQEIGEDYGITKERVHQIGKRAGYDRHHQYPPNRPRMGKTNTCKDCGERVQSGQMRNHRLVSGHPLKAGTRTTLGHVVLLREYYERGLGFLAMGQATGLPPMTVKYHLKRMGTQFRARRRAQVPTEALRAELAFRWHRMNEVEE